MKLTILSIKLSRLLVLVRSFQDMIATKNLSALWTGFAILWYSVGKTVFYMWCLKALMYL
jgi:hypothetical protein